MFRENKQHLQQRMLSTIDGLPDKQAKRLQESWAGVFYRDYFARLDETPFAALYSDKDSRPNIPVNVLVGLEALKSGFNWSDEEMYDACCFDLQVRYALGYHTWGEGQFDLRTVYNFRHRLSEHMQETGQNLIDQAFEQVTDEQIASFQLKTDKLRMDSSQIASNIRNMSRLHLLVEVVQRTHRMLSEIDRARFAEAFAPYLRGSSSQYVYRVKSAEGADRMQEIGALMRRLLEELATIYGDHPTYQMLKRVFSEHFVVEGERLHLKAGQELSANSLQSPDDMEATFRTKNGHSYKGYVANVTETCAPENPLQLIAKVQTAPNLTNDDDLLVEAVPSLKQRLDPKEIYTDGGYNSDESYQATRENGIKHVQTAIRGHSPHARLGLDTFEIATNEQDQPVKVSCPQGQTVAVEVGKGKENYLAHFDAKECVHCPFQDKCPTRLLKRQAQRTLHFSHHDMEIARRRRRIAQDHQSGRNLRAAVESTINSLKHPFGDDQLPVRGRFRMAMMLIGSAAMTNVRRIYRYLAHKPSDQGATAAINALPGAPQTALSYCSLLLARLAGSFTSYRCQFRAHS